MSDTRVQVNLNNAVMALMQAKRDIAEGIAMSFAQQFTVDDGDKIDHLTDAIEEFLR